MEISWKRDCKEYNGVYACDILHAEGYKSCSECSYYDPLGKKILIIKLGATGDVLRTTPLLTALRKKHGNNIHVTWVTTYYNQDLLKYNPYVQRVLIVNEETKLRIQLEHFDYLYNFEIDTPATMYTKIANADVKYGYTFSPDGHPTALNEGAEYYLNRALSDVINHDNVKSYQAMMHELAEVPYEKDDYILPLTEKEQHASNVLREQHPVTTGKTLIGINIGAGTRWPSKTPDKKILVNLIKKLDHPVILLAGEGEEALQEEIIKLVTPRLQPTLTNNPKNTLREFMSVVNACDYIITGDTLALHIALALKKKTLGLFYCTPDMEVEEYGRLTKLVSPLLHKHWYTNDDNYELRNSISVEEILETIKKNL